MILDVRENIGVHGAVDQSVLSPQTVFDFTVRSFDEIMTKHKAEADLDFECAMCGKRFEKAHNLNVHMSMVHPLTQGGSTNNSSSGLLPPGPPVTTISVTGELKAQFNNG